MHKPALDIDALLAFHRSVFGDARMDATDDEDREAEEAAAAAAAAETGDEGDEGDETGGDEGDEGEKALGDKGKQALDRMKAKLKAEREKRAAAEAKLAAATKPKDDTDVEAVRTEATRAATAKANERIVRSEVKAQATGKLADPADAFRFLDLSKFEVDDDGNVDEDDIAEAIDELIKSKPYLGVTQGDGKRFKGTADGGNRGKPARKAQLTEADVKRLYAEGKYEEIESARTDGRLNDLLGITT